MKNLDASAIGELVSRVERLERAAPIGFSAVSRGALRIVSAEGLIVEGSARISGVLTGDGTMTWSGGITFTGPFSINGVTTQNGAYTVTGPFHVNGTTDINGATTVNGLFHIVGNADITGTLAIKGDATLEANLTLTGAAAKITVGSMTISQQAGGYGQIASPTTVYINAPFVVASGVVTAIGNVNVGGALANSGMTNKPGVAANVYVDAAGKFWRVV